MELPPKVDPTFLLRIKRSNPDLFYKIATELENDDLIQLCSLDLEFRKICHDERFWERLWRMKFKTSPPTSLLKKKYLKRNRIEELAEILSDFQREIARLFPGYQVAGKTKDEIIELLQQVEVGENKTLREELTEIAIRLDISELLIFTVQHGSQLRQGSVIILKELKRAEMVEKVLAKLSPKTIDKMTAGLSLMSILRLPRLNDPCNFEMMKEKVHEKIESLLEKLLMPQGVAFLLNNFQDEMEILVVEIYRRKCLELIDYIIIEIENSKIQVLQRVLRELVKKLVDEDNIPYIFHLSQLAGIEHVLTTLPKKSQKEFMEYALKQEDFDIWRELRLLVVENDLVTISIIEPYLEPGNFEQNLELVQAWLDDRNYPDRVLLKWLVKFVGPEMIKEIIPELLVTDDLEKQKIQILQKFILELKSYK